MRKQVFKENKMKHFVGYHSTSVMGRELYPDGKKFTFLSNKLSALDSSINNRVWMICGTREWDETLYRLVGHFTAVKVRESSSEYDYVVSGTEGVVLGTPIQLNDYEWFQDWLKSKFKVMPKQSGLNL